MAFHRFRSTGSWHRSPPAAPSGSGSSERFPPSAVPARAAIVGATCRRSIVTAKQLSSVASIKEASNGAAGRNTERTPAANGVGPRLEQCARDSPDPPLRRSQVCDPVVGWLPHNVGVTRREYTGEARLLRLITGELG